MDGKGLMGQRRSSTPPVRRRLLWQAALSFPVVIVLFVPFLLFAIFFAPLPAEEGMRELAGLRAAVEVEFDALGIAHIAAGNSADAFHALGFVTARDRLFQMDLLRRGAAGRLSEIFGEPVLEEDRWNRVMGFEQLASAILSRLPATQRQQLEAYAAGVNQAMSDSRMFPVEFTLLHYSPESWRPEDSVLVMLAMQALLSWTGDQERAATVMRQALPPSVVDFLTPENDCYNEVLAPRNPQRCVSNAVPAASLSAVLKEAEATGDSGAGTAVRTPSLRGSNGWVAGRPKTRDGRAILANDMHLELAVPNIWYRAELRYPGVSVSGFTLPGIPLVVAGSNGHLAWGLTSIEGDFVDLVMVEQDPGDENRYRALDSALMYGTRSETIHVRGGTDETLKVRTTIWGPVLPMPLLGRPVAVHWTALDPQTTDLGLADLSQVKTVPEAIDLLHRAGGPPLNVLLADSLGNIGWTYMGKIPKRFGMNGLFSESWADGRKGWDGYIPPDEVPSIVNPPEGFLVNANQRMPDAAVPAVIGHDFSGGYRAWRITERLKALTHISERDMLDVQLDTMSDVYRYYQTAALRALKDGDHLGRFSTAELRRYVSAWDGKAETSSLGIALLVEFREQLVEAVLAPLLAKCREIDPAFTYSWSSVDIPVQRIIDSGRPELLPGRHKFHDWDEFLRAVLLRSVEKLVQGEGTESVARSTWGEVSKAEIHHPLAGMNELLNSLLDMPRVPLAGCVYCVRLADGKYGASERLVVAPGHEGEGIAQMPGGQSGQPGSRHYSDQQETWLEGLPAPFLETSFVHKLTLKPVAR
jgi:penicillin amidase